MLIADSFNSKPVLKACRAMYVPLFEFYRLSIPMVIIFAKTLETTFPSPVVKLNLEVSERHIYFADVWLTEIVRCIV